MSFSVTGEVLPGKAIPVSPSGAISTVTPTYIWNANSNATWYQLWVQDSAGSPKIQTWYTSAQSGCSSGSGTCSVTPSTALAQGAAQWWVQTWNSAGNGPWSDGMSFSVQASGLPVAAMLISPSGTIATKSPTFVWNAVPSATWYYLWINDSGASPRIQQWFTAAQVGCASGSGTCSIALGTILTSGASQWWVRRWNESGYGPWSSAMNFTVP